MKTTNSGRDGHSTTDLKGPETTKTQTWNSLAFLYDLQMLPQGIGKNMILWQKKRHVNKFLWLTSSLYFLVPSSLCSRRHHFFSKIFNWYLSIISFSDYFMLMLLILLWFSQWPRNVGSVPKSISFLGPVLIKPPQLFFKF